MIDLATSRRVNKRDNYICRYCGFDGRLFENWLHLSVDHVIRTADGGTDEDSNLVTACRACNEFMSSTKVSSFDEKKHLITQIRQEKLGEWETNVKPTIRH